MNIDYTMKLPFHDVYYSTDPLKAGEDLNDLFNDVVLIPDEDTARDAFVYLIKTARKHGFRLFFIAPKGFFDVWIAEPFENGYATPDTHVPYRGLSNLCLSIKSN